MSLDGAVDLQQTNSSDWRAANLSDALCEGDTIRVGSTSRAAVSLITDAVLRIDENTSIRLVNIVPEPEERSFMDLIAGAIQSFSRQPRKLTVNTPYINGSIEGTEFYMRVAEAHTDISVFEGHVAAANDHGELRLEAGESARAQSGAGPVKRQVVKPREQVQWGLYYPPLFADKNANATLQQVVDRLTTGGVVEARRLVEQVIQAGPASGEAYALRSLIRVVTLEAGALEDGQRAMQMSPSNPGVAIALSYAQQAAFELDAARDTMQKAVAASPNNGLAWSRLAELQLMLDQRAESLASAQKAASLAPNLGRTQSVLGFAALAESEFSNAASAFESAIGLDSADPLGHLGRGLARIASGDLASGRHDLEAAVGLDSNSALLRSYLGKAYFEEKRSELAPEQLDIAAQLDPNDPTSFLYSGILKQTVNRPIEAVKDLETSRALNDNRAVFRSRLLLDKDQAARGTSLARAYQDVGFRRVAVNSATQALSYDPGNASAHRFLSDSYRGEQRTEAARVSELLQAQMLQVLNINPVQPSQSGTNLNIVTSGGPAATGFNEYTPLFERNRHQFNISALGGSNETWAGEAVASGVQGRLSYSLGAYHDESDGYRPNNDSENKAYSVYLQYAVTPRLNVQAEFDRRETEHGDVEMKFDLEDFAANYRREFDKDTARLGLRFDINTWSTILVSGVYSQRDESVIDSDVFEIPGVVKITSDTNADSEIDSTQLDLQYLARISEVDIVAGLSAVDADSETDILLTIVTELPFLPFPNVDEVNQSLEPDSEDERAYIYASVSFPENVRWTAAVTYSEFEQQDTFDFGRTSPKFGVEWDLNDQFRLRGAYFKLVKPILAANRGLEPTQIAGFNQLTDEPNGTRSESWAAALDWRGTAGFYGGVEWVDRDIDALAVDLNTGSGVFEEHEETQARAYLSWSATTRLALRAEAVYDEFKSSQTNTADAVPAKLETLTLPVSASYFHPTGFFGTVTATYVDQEVVSAFDPLTGANPLPQGDEQFWVTDLSVGYRIPKRRGIISFSVQNIFDEEFSYLDDTFRSVRDEPIIAPYIPEVTAVLKASLSF